MKVTFINEPLLQPVGDGAEWLLASDFHVRIEDGEEGGDAPIALTVPMGFYTDLASVPRLPGAYMLFAGRARRSAILHDYLYEMRYPREWADAAFRAAMRAEGVGMFARWSMWAGVRLGGGAIYAARAPKTDNFNPG